MADETTRIICANIHHDTGEVEIVIEREEGGLVDNRTVISTLWLDQDALFEEGVRFVREDV